MKVKEFALATEIIEPMNYSQCAANHSALHNTDSCEIPEPHMGQSHHEEAMEVENKQDIHQEVSTIKAT